MEINKIRKLVTILVASLILAMTGISCSNEFDEHYAGDYTERSELNLIDYMKTREELSTFVKMLQITGYEDTLKRSQSFTVFAPTNEALSGVDMEDTENLKLLVGNHLTSYTQTTPGEIHGFNGKYLKLYRVGAKYYYSNLRHDIEITEPNLLTKNGIVHITDQYLPYIPNIWEYIQQASGLDSLRSYINSLTTVYFDKESSYDDNGIFVDSVFVQSNRVLNSLGLINSEKNIYTAILPTNEAWNTTYDKIFPFFKSTDKVVDGIMQNGISRQITKTKWAIIQDFLFNGYVESPTNKDSLISTSGNVYHSPDYLFAATEQQSLSNGYGYIADAMNNKLEDSWVRTISVEAENNSYSLRTKSDNYNLNTYGTLGTTFQASNNYYVRFENLPASDYSYAWARFPIPNTLANVKYNIYCVFVPITAIDTADTRPYKLKFYLSYVDSLGKKIIDKAITVPNNVTNGGEITKLLIAENYEFSYADLIEYSNTSINYKDNINVFLKVENAATIKEERRGTYSRNVAIDRIILEPVMQ
ncbi:MAG: fasciclin domain-containing protein [Marinilabiliaceae bacterium]|nr:fasciclin domain-containing protein [Marinilabiliaceae bacterium]MBN2819105.1 fasciclin domain-containing protein [Bacteroidales bacterium]